MASILFVFVVALLSSGALGADDKWRRYETMVESMNQNSLLQDAWDEEHYPKFKGGRDQEIPEAQLTCPSLAPSSTTPASVHALRPSDVRVVAAIGDSITAGNGALAATPLGLLTEFRGRSFSMGGDHDATKVVTMPNILRTHVDDLVGHSTGRGKKGSTEARLNFAVPGSTAKDLRGQALELVDALRQDPGVDFDHDWKVVTVFIGGNDVCDYFDGEVEINTPDNYIKGIKDALDVLHATVPKTFVNLVEVLDLSILPDLSKGLICPLLHRYLCKAVASGKRSADVKQLVNDYNTKLRDLVEGGKYDTRDDFTVVVQPFFRKTSYPRQTNGQPDWSFFAPDCFHFSAKGHAAAGEALWNNMLEPVGAKSQQWHPGTRHVVCPTEAEPYFYTYKNSPTGWLARLGCMKGFTKEQNEKVYPMIVGGGVGFFVVVAVVVAIVVARRRTKRPLGASLENIPGALEASTQESDARIEVPLAVANPAFDDVKD